MKAVAIVAYNLPSEYKVLKLPRPGDLLVAKQDMKSRVINNGFWIAWPEGPVMRIGEQGLVVHAFMHESKYRMVVMVGDRLMRFSQKPHCVALNWERHKPLDET